MSCDSCFRTSRCGEGGKNFLTPMFCLVVWCLTGCLAHMIWDGGGEGEVLFLSSLFFFFFFSTYISLSSLVKITLKCKDMSFCLDSAVMGNCMCFSVG